MIRRIIKLPFRAAKGTINLGKLAYRAASAALLGVAIYQGAKKVFNEPSSPPEPEKQKKAGKKTGEKKNG